MTFSKNLMGRTLAILRSDTTRKPPPKPPSMIGLGAARNRRGGKMRAVRNHAIMHSPYPLRTSLVLTLRAAGYAGTSDRNRYKFLARVLDELWRSVTGTLTRSVRGSAGAR